MIGSWAGDRHLHVRQNNGRPDTSAFNIVNGRIFTPGLGIVLAVSLTYSYVNPLTDICQPQPFTPMGGDFLHIALDVAADGKLPVPPRSMDDPLTQVFNFTLFLTSTTLQKNFTISNITTSTPPLANIMNQELGQTVKHINFEWPECLVGDGQDTEGTMRGEYNISIHQNYRLNGNNRYSIFNLPISVTNSISRFPGAGQLSTKPIPGPLSANGGRMPCASIENPMMDFAMLVQSVNNPPGQPLQDIQIQTTPRRDGGQVGGPGQNSGGNNGGEIGGGTGSSGNGNNNGQGQIAPGGSGSAIGGAAEIASVGIFGAIMFTTTTVLFTAIVL